MNIILLRRTRIKTIDISLSKSDKATIRDMEHLRKMMQGSHGIPPSKLDYHSLVKKTDRELKVRDRRNKIYGWYY